MDTNLKTAFFKTMEELSVVGLAHRKESAAPLTEARGEELGLHVAIGYPLAVVLRLRVLQIVCGISAMVMGSVAYIEERKESNLFLGIPAGAFTVVAAALSIHTSRGWGGGAGGAGGAGAAGGVGGAGLVAALWLAACSLLLALLVQCARTILHKDSPKLQPTASDLLVLAGVQAALAATALAAALACAALDARA